MCKDKQDFIKTREDVQMVVKEYTTRKQETRSRFQESTRKTRETKTNIVSKGLGTIRSNPPNYIPHVVVSLFQCGTFPFHILGLYRDTPPQQTLTRLESILEVNRRAPSNFSNITTSSAISESLCFLLKPKYQL